MVRTTLEIQRSTLEDLKEIGRKTETYDQIIKRRLRCVNSGCQAKGNFEVNVQVGNYGNLTFFVCGKCIGRFSK